MENLIVYGRKGCARCKIICQLLTQKGKVFDYIDVETLSEKEELDIIDRAFVLNIRELPIITYNGIIIKDIKEIF